MKVVVLSLNTNVLMVFNYILLWCNECKRHQALLKRNIKYDDGYDGKQL